MVNCVITPTYRGHFPHIKKYLQSFDRYLEDRDFPLFFIISRDEVSDFERVTAGFAGRLNINVLILEDLLKSRGITRESDDLLRSFGRFSFQTMKKLEAALHIGAERFLILDSESMLVRPTNMKSLFDRFFAKPFIVRSAVGDRRRTYRLTASYQFLQTINRILGRNDDVWLLESFHWFYELRILKDLVRDHGRPLDIISRLENPEPGRERESVLEILLYYHYLYGKAASYGYAVLDFHELFTRYLDDIAYFEFVDDLQKSKFWMSGFLESIFYGVTRKNYRQISRMFTEHNFSVIRSQTLSHNFVWMRRLIKASGVHILASDQNNCVGVNFSVKFYVRLMVGNLISKFRSAGAAVSYQISPSYRMIREQSERLAYIEDQIAELKLSAKARPE